MIRCVIIDDEPYAISVLESYIPKVPQLQLVGKTTNPLNGIEMAKTLKADLVFLDIQMDEMNGMEVASLLAPEIKIIFCTAFLEFAVETYNLEAVDYLLKPIALPRFLKAVQRASNVILNPATRKVEEIPDDYIFVKVEQKGKMIKLNFDEIDYIEAMKNYVAFCTHAGKVLAHLTMKEVEQRLPKSSFIRIHKSYIVSIRQVIAIENNCIILEKRKEHIPISESYRSDFIERLKGNLLI